MTRSRLLRDHMDDVASLGCILCGGEAQLHHPIEGRHSQRKVSDWLVIPLCRFHHDDWHENRWRYKGVTTEWDLLARVLERLAEERGRRL